MKIYGLNPIRLDIRGTGPVARMPTPGLDRLKILD